MSYSQAVQAQNNPTNGDYNNNNNNNTITLHNHNRRAYVLGFYVWNDERQDWSRNRLDSVLEPDSDSKVMLSRQSNGCIHQIKVVYSVNRESTTNDDSTSNEELTTKFNSCKNRHLVVQRRQLSPYQKNPDRN
ncbi:MAG: hypothetical protein V7K77_23340 [Nostoc sp.]|uniref:hypothetical protein n=1 Tax=Nostoc sp. TaxID=1180 RepID=UPI002FFB621F